MAAVPAAIAAPAAASATKAALIKYGPQLLNLAGNIFGNKNKQKAQGGAAYNAYNQYLNNIQKQREAAKQYMQGDYEAGEKQFFGEANRPLQEIEQVAQDIGQAGTEQQQEFAKQMASNLASQGVRGGQAATLMGRGAGQLSREALRDINQMKAEEAMKRQTARLGYTAQKGLIPYGTLNTAEWLHLPSASEQAMMSKAINAKFGV